MQPPLSQQAARRLRWAKGSTPSQHSSERWVPPVRAKTGITSLSRRRETSQSSGPKGSTTRESANNGCGSANNGCGSANNGCGSDDNGCGSDDNGCGSDDNGCGSDDNGYGSDDNGCGSDDNGYGSAGNGDGSADNLRLPHVLQAPPVTNAPP